MQIQKADLIKSSKNIKKTRDTKHPNERVANGFHYIIDFPKVQGRVSWRSTIGDGRSAKGTPTVLKEPRIPMGFPGALGCPKRYPEDSWMKVVKDNVCIPKYINIYVILKIQQVLTCSLKIGKRRNLLSNHDFHPRIRVKVLDPPKDLNKNPRAATGNKN